MLLDRLAIRPTYSEVFSLFNLNNSSQDMSSNFFYYYIFNQIPVFLFGIFIYILAHDKKGIGLSIAETIAMLFFLFGFILASPKLSVISLIGALVLLIMRRIEHFPNLLIWIGRQSYSLYLFHFAVINMMLLILGHRPILHSIGVFLCGYIVAVTGAIMVSLATKPLLEDVGSSIGRFIVNLNERRI